MPSSTAAPSIPTAGWLSGCEVVVARWPGPRFSKPPTMIVLHRGQGPGDIAGYFRDPSDGRPVSAHFVVNKSGKRIQCVSLYKRAQHAGALYNYRSIGIETQGPIGSDWPEDQLASLLVLLRQVVGVYPTIKTIAAHSTLAPLTRRDPGKNFPWHRLECLGLRLRP